MVPETEPDGAPGWQQSEYEQLAGQGSGPEQSGTEQLQRDEEGGEDVEVGFGALLM